MGKLVCETFTFKNFKERLRIVKELERKYKIANISINNDMIIVQYS